MIAIALALAAATSAPADQTAEFRARDQALLDDFTYGTKGAWDKWMSPEGLYVDENGATITKPQMLAQIEPLGAGVTGNLVIAEYRLRVVGDVAFVFHRDDEEETWHGQVLKANYLTTETWRREGGDWKLEIAQVYVVAVDPPAVTLPPETLDQYVGRFSASPDIVDVVRREGAGLTIGREGNAAKPFLAEAPDVLFVPGRPRFRYVIQRDGSGRVSGFIERREGEDVRWTRIP
jgi:hypothetical protein